MYVVLRIRLYFTIECETCSETLLMCPLDYNVVYMSISIMAKPQMLHLCIFAYCLVKLCIIKLQ